MASLKNSISVKLRPDQRLKLDWLSAKNYNAKPVWIIRASIDLVALLADMNGGLLPLPQQLRLQLIRRAEKDAKRSHA